MEQIKKKIKKPIEIPCVEANPDKVKDIVELISSQQEIRLLVMSGGGFGNQRGIITLIHRLFLYGFKGTFNILAEQTTQEKIIKLITEYELFNEKITYSINLLYDYDREIKYTYKHVNLAFCFADERRLDRCSYFKHSQCEFYNVNCIISINPTDYWNGGPGNAIYLNDNIYSYDTKSYTYFPQILATKYDLTKEKYLELLLNNSDTINTKLHELLSENYYTQAVYGLYDWQAKNIIRKKYTQNNVNKGEEITRIIKIYKSIELDKPTIIFLLCAEELPAEIQNIPIQSILNFETSDLKKEFYLIQIKSLSMILFDGLLLHTSLPPILEGANSVSFVKELSNKGYLHGGRYMLNDDIAIPSDDIFTNLLKLWNVSKLELTQSEVNNLDATTKLLSKIINKEKDIINFFTKWHLNFIISRPDALASMLKEYIKLSKKPLNGGSKNTMKNHKTNKSSKSRKYSYKKKQTQKLLQSYI